MKAFLFLVETHQNDHLAQTSIKGHTNACFLPPFRTHIFGVTKHPNSGVTNALDNFIRFLFCVCRMPKKGEFEITKKEIRIQKCF